MLKEHDINNKENIHYLSFLFICQLFSPYCLSWKNSLNLFITGEGVDNIDLMEINKLKGLQFVQQNVRSIHHMLVHDFITDSMSLIAIRETWLSNFVPENLRMTSGWPGPSASPSGSIFYKM